MKSWKIRMWEGRKKANCLRNPDYVLTIFSTLTSSAQNLHERYQYHQSPAVYHFYLSQLFKWPVCFLHRPFRASSSQHSPRAHYSCDLRLPLRDCSLRRLARFLNEVSVPKRRTDVLESVNQSSPMPSIDPFQPPPVSHEIIISILSSSSSGSKMRVFLKSKL